MIRQTLCFGVVLHNMKMAKTHARHAIEHARILLSFIKFSRLCVYFGHFLLKILPKSHVLHRAGIIPIPKTSSQSQFTLY